MTKSDPNSNSTTYPGLNYEWDQCPFLNYTEWEQGQTNTMQFILNIHHPLWCGENASIAWMQITWWSKHYIFLKVQVEPDKFDFSEVNGIYSNSNINHICFRFWAHSNNYKIRLPRELEQNIVCTICILFISQHATEHILSCIHKSESQFSCNKLFSTGIVQLLWGKK